MNRTIAAKTKQLQQCPRCDSTNLVEQKGDDEPTKHYGRLMCGDCGKWIAWLRDPSVTISSQIRERHINRLLKYSDHNGYSLLTSWDRQFLKNISNKRWLTDKQATCYQKICIKMSSVVGLTEDE